ncbi:flagellar basal body-associated FliL family protein [Pseudokineococcus marinus]|uniref:Flagellar protein FliL n=1 Tax=Pseudokineococcus marinus TaxID=351215 RepID=A0A849BKF3_9ACTN|nr:flagellar basal body-associated FliL family protein [Pseudokineococcus marinus]NNH23759.1 flagellar basal body-associated FliL family protein [Pseudokineococcus marinus]
MPAKTAAPADAEAEAPKKKKLPLLIGGVVALVAVGAGAWFFVLAPGDAEAAAEPEPEPEKGEVVPLEPVSINLANGSYLRLGLALQQTVEAAEAVDGSEALDLAIKTFSGRTTEELAKPEVRDQLKAELLGEVEEAYPDEVMEIYFTEFVTQ